MDAGLSQGLAAVTTAVIAAVISSLVVPFAIRLAEVLDAIDHPGERRVQKTAIPRLGGIAIFLGLSISATGVSLASGYDPMTQGPQGPVLSIMLATALIFLLGLVDDVVGASVVQKLAVQVAAAVLLIRAGVVIKSVDLPVVGMLDLGVWGPLLSIVWIVGITNAINLLDGLDGLASGVVAIIASSFLVVAYMQTDRPQTVIFTAAIVGACLGFLRHNWAPARVFMGDSGSLTLGFLLAAVSIQSVSKTFATVAIVIPILALGLPIVDTVMVMMVRFSRKGAGSFGRRVISMFRPDREHFHHVLERVVGDRRRIVMAIYSLVFAFCAFGLVVAVTKSAHLGVSLLVVELLVVLGVRFLVTVRDRTEIEDVPSNIQEFASPKRSSAADSSAASRASSGA